MPYLLLLRHSNPQIDSGNPSPTWGLSEKGRDRCIPLAERLKVYELDVIVTSHEPKAAQTGQIVAEQLGIPVHEGEDLHEHERSNVGWIDDHDKFTDLVKRTLQQPDQLILGTETADQAYVRFSSAVEAVVAAHPDKNIGIATHGTVMSIFAERKADVDVLAFWQALKMPAYVVFDLPDYKLVEVVNNPADG